MADDVVDRLLEDQKDLASHIRPDLEVQLVPRRAESELDAARSEDVAGEAPHALVEVAQLVALRVDYPDDVAHRIHQLARSPGDDRETFGHGRRDTSLVTRHLAQHGDARKAGAYVIMKVRSNARANSLNLKESPNAIAVQTVCDEFNQ